MNNKINLPITGICSFAKYPICDDVNNLNADIAILGVPYDTGVGFLSGAKFGPRRIREVSTHYARGDAGFYDPEKDTVYLGAPWKIVDCGDADVVTGDILASFDNIEWAVRSIIEKGAMPVVIGGDHSISIPVGRALNMYEDVTVVQFDAHLDWSDAPGGQRFTNGSPMRRLSEMDHIGAMAQIGLRGLGSSRKVDFDSAREYGSVLIPASEVRRKTPEEIVAMIPEGKNYFVSIDIDSLDISQAPGVGSPSPGGLLYHELMPMLELLADRGNIVCFDLVEVAPQYDPAGITPRVAAMIALGFMGYILKSKENADK